jgi:hypothetical protein
MNDWYLRRRDDPEGQFYRKMSASSPRGQSGAATRQGRYVFTAAGTFLGYNNNRGPERLTRMLTEALAAWRSLPEARRGGGETIAASDPEAQYDRRLPTGAQVVTVHTRVLKRGPAGEYIRLGPDDGAQDTPYAHRGFGAAVDHFWLRTEDVHALLQAVPLSGVGESVAMPPPIAQRLVRYHVVDNTRGEPSFWTLDQVKGSALRLSRVSQTTLRLHGTIQLQTSDGARGFEGTLEGVISQERERMTGFEAVILGEHWGEGPYTKGARPGRTPLGVAFRLTPHPSPADLIPPQASGWLRGYFAADQ